VTTTQLITGLIAYVLSLVISLVLTLSVHGRNGTLRVLAAAHAVLWTATAVAWLVASPAATYLFLSAVCSGVAASGWMIRSRRAFALRLYFGLYLLTLPLFLYSPSMTVRLLSAQWNTSLPGRFDLGNGMLLEPQAALIARKGQPVRYKVIRDYGLFYRTLERDIDFGHPLDSIRVIRYAADTLLVLRGYFSAPSPDSAEAVSDLVPDDAQEGITRRKP